MDPEKWKPDHEDTATEVVTLHRMLLDYIQERDQQRAASEQLERDAGVGRLAAQVAHDIRSPLTALNMVADTSSGLSEENRHLVKLAVTRVNDIANHLLAKNKNSPNVNGETSTPNGETKEELCYLPSAIDAIVSEKRLELVDRTKLSLEVRIERSGLASFAKIAPHEFKRIISNLINNSAQAIPGAGDISVNLSADETQATVMIQDNGSGISDELIGKIGTRGITGTGGNGLGLFHAKRVVEENGGRLEVFSTPGFWYLNQPAFPSLPASKMVSERVEVGPWNSDRCRR